MARDSARNATAKAPAKKAVTPTATPAKAPTKKAAPAKKAVTPTATPAKGSAKKAAATIRRIQALESRVVPVSAIRPKPGYNPRLRFDEKSLRELADSITELGLQQPPKVRPMDDGTFELVYGERRWRAVQLLGWKEITVLIDPEMSDRTHAAVALIENLHREDLDPIEEANGYKTLKTVHGYTITEIAAATRRSQPAISNAIRLLDLPMVVTDLIQEGKLTAAHGRAIASYSDFPKLATAIARKAVETGWSSKDLERESIPYAWTFQQEGIIRSVSDGLFDKKQCQACPFKSYRNGYCLKPEHFDQLQAEAIEKNNAKLKAKAPKVTKSETTNEPGKTTDMAVLFSATGHELIVDHTKKELATIGCSEECVCRGFVKDRKGIVQAACLQKGKFQAKKNALTKKNNKGLREHIQESFAAACTALDGVSELSTPALILVFKEFLTTRQWTKDFLMIANELGRPLPVDHEKLSLLALFGDYTPTQLLQLIGRVQLERERRRVLGNLQWTKTFELADFAVECLGPATSPSAGAGPTATPELPVIPTPLEATIAEVAGELSGKPQNGVAITSEDLPPDWRKQWHLENRKGEWFAVSKGLRLTTTIAAPDIDEAWECAEGLMVGFLNGMIGPNLPIEEEAPA